VGQVLQLEFQDEGLLTNHLNLEPSVFVAWHRERAMTKRNHGHPYRGWRIGKGTALLLMLALSGTAGAVRQRPSDRSDENPQRYDLVINGGRVIDPESGLDAQRSIGIVADKIAAISATPLLGRQSIDATGLIVAPGFIDLHSHAQQFVGARMQAMDGVTTALELESGSLPIDAFYERVTHEGRPINFGVSVSWPKARQEVMDKAPPSADFDEGNTLSNWSSKVANAKELQDIIKILSDGLSAGGLGIGIPLGYATPSGRKEFYEINQLAAKRGVPTFVHYRFQSTDEPDSSFEAAEEVVAVAAATGAHIHVCHINSSDLRDGQRIVAMFKAAQARGVPITIEAYPYSGAASSIGSSIFRGPNWRERLGNIQISDLELDGTPLDQATLDRLQREAPDTIVIAHMTRPGIVPGDQELLDQAVLYPGGAIASDSVPWTLNGKIIQGDLWPLPAAARSHPRSAGTFSRFLKQYVRERQAISLLEGIRKLTLIPAQTLQPAVPQMANKGRIRIGADADIDVFDLTTITDKATFGNPAQASVGMRWVFVGGVPVVEHGHLLPHALPGKPIRAPH
jgi:N-acyl-D-glutamate deacylase